MTTSTRGRVNARRALAATAAVAAAGATMVSIQHASAEESEPEAAQDCAMETLPIPEGLGNTTVTAMSDDGSVIAYHAQTLDQEDPEALDPRLLMYADGEVTEIQMPDPRGYIEDVDSTGAAVGWTIVSSSYVPFVWRDGELTELPTEYGGAAYGMNANGDVVGIRDDEEHRSLPVVWPADGSGPIDLPLPEEAEGGFATAIGDDGTVVGHYEYDDGNTVSGKPYLWHADGTGADLPMPEGVDVADVASAPIDLKGDWVSGYLYDWDLETSGVRWNLAEGTAEMTGLDEPVVISADGDIAGNLPELPTAAYQSGDTIVELPGKVDPADNIDRDTAEAISADGSLIAGNVFIGTDAYDWPAYNAVVWTCA